MPSATSRPVSAPLVVVCGLQAEAKIARADGVVLLVGGGDQRRLEADLARVASDSRALLSFGVAGGLASLLRPGDVRIAGTVVLPSGERVSADAGWSSELARRLDAPMATMVGADSPVADVASKAALNQSTGAELVDAPQETYYGGDSGRLSRSSISVSRFCTWRENMNSAGR